MKNVLIIGSGISGLACAVKCAGLGLYATLISPVSSERAQSVMAAGGINAVTEECEEGDSVSCHIEDTLRGGARIGGKNAVTGLCEHAGDIIRYLEGIGTVFSVDSNGRPMIRAFGGQSFKRTHYCGSSTGKQIVSALIMEARRYEADGLIERKLRLDFHSALIKDGECFGALLYDEKKRLLVPFYADALVMATGGQNALFGKTTGTCLCDGYAAGKLFMQGADLKNLEFIQFHPTTLETAQKKMLISEAVRGEGGRLFYEDGGKRIYFMEDKYGPKGNLQTRDLVSREINNIGRDVYLDISFLDKKQIDVKLPEVRDLCRKYGGIDISQTPIPVAPAVHFFMGGIAVHLNHETNIKDLYAVGECASMYHGANRLGGNSLLAAIYSGWVAADDIFGRTDNKTHPDFDRTIRNEEDKLAGLMSSKSSFSVIHIRDMLSDTMRKDMNIIRTESTLKEGIDDVDYLLSVAGQIWYDNSESTYTNYSLTGLLTLARAALTSALSRTESRGAHFRNDHPDMDDDYAFSTLISYDDGAYNTCLDKERVYEN